MSQGKFVSYLRVSTSAQGRSGLGLEAQREAVRAFLETRGGQEALVEEVQEVESGKRSDRPNLAEALRLCRLHRATLVIAKLDRLSRDAAFLFNLEADLKRMNLRFVAADMPDANELTIHIMAVVAQAEREMISARTRAALQAAKARGVKLGGTKTPVASAGARGRQNSIVVRQERAQERAGDVSKIIEELRASGLTSLRQIAKGLNGRGIPTARGGEWSAVQVDRVMKLAQHA